MSEYRRLGAAPSNQWRALFVLAFAALIPGWCHATDASIACERESGIRVDAEVVALASDSVAFRFSLKNTSTESIVVTQDLFPWLDMARVSVVLLDWRGGGSIQDWVADSKLRFSAVEADSARLGVYSGRRRSALISDFLESVGSVIGPGNTVNADLTFSEPKSGFSLSEPDLTRLRREGVFLWTARINTRRGECLQSGLTALD